MTAIERLTATDAARTLVERLRAQHGELIFYLSHGCCDGSTPMCLPARELQPGAADVRVGEAAGVPFWMSGEQREYLANLQLTLDVAPGNNGAYSLEDGSGQRFVLKMRLFSDEELGLIRG